MPIEIDIYNTNIHEEFLEIDVSELNEKNKSGEL